MFRKAATLCAHHCNDAALNVSSIFTRPVVVVCMQIVVALAAAYGVGMQVYPEMHAWTMFSVSVATGNWDPCFFSNPYISSLFMAVHNKRIGPNPKLVRAPLAKVLFKHVIIFAMFVIGGW